MSASTSYRAVLALPSARRLFLAALAARLCYGVLSIPLLLAVRAGTGSYALAGTTVGLAGLGTALLGPFRARLVERHPAVLRPMALVYAVLLALLATACAERWPAPLLVATAVLAGCCPPPVGPLMRTLWGRLAADEAQLQSALSLDTAAESTVFALGPVLAGSLVAASSAAVVLGSCAVLVLIGFGLLAAALPAPAESGRATGRGRTPLLAKGFLPLVGLAAAVAAALAMAEVGLLASWGTLITGVLTTLFSVGGVVGGLLYGRLSVPVPLSRRPLLLAGAAALCYALPAGVPVVAVGGVGLLLAGAFSDVLLVTCYQLVDHLVPAGSRTEAGAWLNTGYNLGAAAGAALAGALVERTGAGAVLPVAAAVVAGFALLAALAAVVGARRGAAPDGAGAEVGHELGEELAAELGREPADQVRV
ncbi:MFS transporter [Kitasatospora viridis]|uniref:Putative MFS family arabinose efflux permease n=1 Tax=Kitasatospora viridis TaxID=281105 RepID=A0A561UN62_9ACTN|nr:MFS transporter [Kitasatospora viridis]TWG00799.1 putative MFS family arabinose efflux permease [Kitasatospora viridis]